MKTLTASAAYSQVAQSVEAIANDAPATIETMSPGDVVRQGDLYIVALDTPIPGGKVAPRQLAPGTSQGSRHVAEGDCDVLSIAEGDAIRAVNQLVPATKGQTLFVGPMILARGPVTIEHPEHGHRTLPGDSAYLVLFQRTWAKEIRRTLD